jgi:antitoxin PrlF
MSATVTVKGQVTIPKHIRQRAGIHAGADVEFQARDDEIVLRKCRRGAPSQGQKDAGFAAYLERVRGTVDLGMSTNQFMELMRGE